jgi:NitT/TauT family transport system substrate-binding protein
MKRKWILIAGIALVVLIGALFIFSRIYSSRPIDPNVRVTDTHSIEILPLYVAEEKDLFTRHGLVISWSNESGLEQAEKLFASGQSDLLVTTFANLLPAMTRQPDSIHLLFPMFESQEKPGSYVLVKQDSAIKTIGDLRGKSLGTVAGLNQQAYARSVLKKLRLGEPEDVRLMQVAESEQLQGLFDGAYEALFTVEPYGSMAISRGARVVESGVRTKYISSPFWLGSAAIHTTMAKEQSEKVKAILDVLEEASKYIAMHDAEAREILARRTGIEPHVAQTSALYTWIARPRNQDLLQIQAHMNLLVEEKLVDKSIAVTPIFEGLPKD